MFGGEVGVFGGEASPLPPPPPPPTLDRTLIVVQCVHYGVSGSEQQMIMIVSHLQRPHPLIWNS